MWIAKLNILTHLKIGYDMLKEVKQFTRLQSIDSKYIKSRLEYTVLFPKIKPFQQHRTCIYGIK